MKLEESYIQMGVAMEEKELVSNLKNAETKHKAFQQLVHLYKERIYWHARRMVGTHEDADDVVQNVFIKIFKGINNFNSQSKLYTWIYRIATNECLTFIEKSKRNHATPIEERFDAIADIDAQPERILSQLMSAIRQLPPKQRAVFNMKYFEEMPYRKMSEIMGTSEGALKASFHHAKLKIKQHILNNIKVG